MIGDEVVPAGTYPGTGTVTVTARALLGYVIADGAVAEWTMEFSADSVDPTDPGTPGPTDPGAPAPGGSGNGGNDGDLASTGVDASLGILALLALLAGGLIVTRRRKVTS